jgi:hypothetical protein
MVARRAVQGNYRPEASGIQRLAGQFGHVLDDLERLCSSGH